MQEESQYQLQAIMYSSRNKNNRMHHKARKVDRKDRREDTGTKTSTHIPLLFNKEAKHLLEKERIMTSGVKTEKTHVG